MQHQKTQIAMFEEARDAAAAAEMAVMAFAAHEAAMAARVFAPVLAMGVIAHVFENTHFYS
jgi:hypothetical protein